MKFEFLTSIIINIRVLWEVTPYNLLNKYLHLQGGGGKPALFRILTTEDRAPARTQSRNFLTRPYATYFHDFFFPVVTIVQKPESADQMGEKGTLLTVHMFKFNSNLIEGTRAQMSSGSKEINLIFFYGAKIYQFSSCVSFSEKP